VHNRVENWWKYELLRLGSRAQPSIPACSPAQIEQCRARPRIFAFSAFLLAGAAAKKSYKNFMGIGVLYAYPGVRAGFDQETSKTRGIPPSSS
jgi:hypothetical protein